MSLDLLGTHRLSWVDLAAFIEHAPRDSAVARAVLGEEGAMWGLTEHLLAAAVDALNSGNWQRGGDRHAPKPKPVKRPGGKEQQYGKGAIPIAEFKAWWDAH